ncbi:hypothetical protein OG689_27600 [Kitasatospora sp. NBC_00240]|uniref:hypothetical protein n=1 Tax=Kitasatospora sp. NBC_00240 TaxID=2903567 RepID=UPI0022590E92|nr:hypothetical protein [Kitasatospora sp. NBC_00240]MCX5212989.1 hypothetical protein [Kitasatospora sp. NBC_00240]
MGTLEPPANLGEQGGRLWSDVNDENHLRVDELRILEDACREVDLVERLEDALRGQPLLVKGSMGQVVASPLVQELRQHRALVARLLGALRLPDDEEAGGERDARARSSQARQAALARWGRTG